MTARPRSPSSAGMCPSRSRSPPTAVALSATHPTGARPLMNDSFLLLRRLPLFPRQFVALARPGLPHLPGRVPLGVQVFELLPVLERVHAGPVAAVLVGEQLPLLDQPLEGLLHQLLAVAHVLEDLRAEGEV